MSTGTWGGICRWAGTMDEAVSELTRAIEQMTLIVGAKHHAVALAESNLAYCLAQKGDLDRADARSPGL